MKHFVFNIKSKKSLWLSDNDWAFKRVFRGHLGCFLLKSPLKEEITYSKGPVVRYVRHTVVGIGYVDDKLVFKGIALFDLASRGVISLVIMLGVGYASGKIIVGVLWSLVFYLLISFLSSSDDEYILCKAKLINER